MPQTFKLDTPHHEIKHSKPKIPQIGHPIPLNKINKKIQDKLKEIVHEIDLMETKINLVP